ncbi:MAG: efflux RND transporter periplasmic adaptor subunit [Isosphaeraceae bacterium]
MRQQEISRPARLKRRIVVSLLGFALLAGAVFGWMEWHDRKLADRYLVGDVRRTDLFPILSASGRIESGHRTVIKCELENVTVGVRGQRVMAGGASILLSVIPEGSQVKQGDVLAVLDSSDYEELLRTQQIAVERAKADLVQAELDHEVAELAVREFKDGIMRETIEDFEGRLFLARSELERESDRLDWCLRMKEKGYVAASTVSAEVYRKAQLALNLAREDSAFQLFKKFTGPKTIRELEGAVKGAAVMLEYQQLRHKRHIQRLATLERQVDHCTIRAPHDGFVIYANTSNRDPAIEPGLPVRQKQDLFYLPDLTDMEVVAMLHESIIDDVGPGMRANVHVEGMSNRRLEGHVLAVSPMAVMNWRTDVRYFEGKVKLENPPRGLRPGMTAEVDIAMPRREQVLAVPAGAVALDDGHEVCFVVHEDGLERREVKLGQVTRDMAEVTEGLTEGEQVVLNPSSNEEAEFETPKGGTHESTTSQTAANRGSSSGVIAALQ